MTSKKFAKKMSTNNKTKEELQQANNMANFLNVKGPNQSANSECSKQVREFISFFCRVHKDEKAVYRTDDELFNEFYDWNMSLGRRVFGRQAFLFEFLELQKKLPKDSLSLKREFNVSVVLESLLGKRLRED